MNTFIFKPGAEITIDDNKCIGCGRCVEVCPEDVYALKVFDNKTKPNKKYKSTPLKPNECILCLSCIEICPTKAIFIYGKQ